MMQGEAYDRLMQYEIKPSVQRIAIMQYLMEHYTHPTADVIFNALYPKMPTLSKATVYNTLNVFVEKGAVQLITIDEKNARYDANITPHLHFRCRGCGSIYDVEWSGFSLPQELKEMFAIDDVQIYCKGYCNHCKTSIH